MSGFMPRLLVLAVAGSPRHMPAVADVNRYRVVVASVPTRVTRAGVWRFPRRAVPGLGADRPLLHLEQELGVALGLLHPLHQHLERLLRLERVQRPADLPEQPGVLP